MKMKPKTINVLVTVGASLVGVALAASVALLLVVPALRNTCTLFNKRCINVEYARLPNGEILVKDPGTGLTYWYDGRFIRSYGPNLPGTCPTNLAVGATGVLAPTGADRVLCDRFDPSGVCVSKDAVETPPTSLTGTPITNSASGERVLEPAFVMNATTLAASEQQVLCSRARGVVENSFVDAPTGSVKMYVPGALATGSVGPAYIFKVLRANGVYTPPAGNPEPPVCTGHGRIDPNTTLCLCEPGYTGSLCATRMCENDNECAHGKCNSGLCECEAGWTGDACDLRACEPSCVNGRCDPSGACVCTPGFTGDACDEMTCVPSCGDHGTCNPNNGVCECEDGWIGLTCDNVACPANCSGNGQCLAPDGVCECVHGWIGVACDTPACTNNCSQRGECDMSSNTCSCDQG